MQNHALSRGLSSYIPQFSHSLTVWGFHFSSRRLYVCDKIIKMHEKLMADFVTKLWRGEWVIRAITRHFIALRFDIDRTFKALDR
jgi:hypothetical protein